MLPAILPLFPLAQVVLFPHPYLPLHIFEPRYRQLTADVLATHRHFILGVAKDAARKDPLPQDEPCFPTATLACIVKAATESLSSRKTFSTGAKSKAMARVFSSTSWFMPRASNSLI